MAVEEMPGNDRQALRLKSLRDTLQSFACYPECVCVRGSCVCVFVLVHVFAYFRDSANSEILSISEKEALFSPSSVAGTAAPMYHIDVCVDRLPLGLPNRPRGGRT